MKPQPATITSLDPPQATEIREKPQFRHFQYETIHIEREPSEAYKLWREAMVDYQASQSPMDIENNGYGIDGRVWITYGIQSIAEELKLNQPVQIVRTGDKCKIVKSN